MYTWIHTYTFIFKKSCMSQNFMTSKLLFWLPTVNKCSHKNSKKLLSYNIQSVYSFGKNFLFLLEFNPRKNNVSETLLCLTTNFSWFSYWNSIEWHGEKSVNKPQLVLTWLRRETFCEKSIKGWWWKIR